MEKKTGFTRTAELLNGRVAMVSIVIIAITELVTGLGPINQILSIFGSHL